jgi:RNA-binding protein 23/39
MRATPRDLRAYFHKMGCAVKDISFLYDKRTNKHKGGAYVEMASLQDAAQVLALSNQPPDFQRFPIVIKPSEAEKNYIMSGMPTDNMSGIAGKAAQDALSAEEIATLIKAATRLDTWNKTINDPLIGDDGTPYEAQNVYVGGLESRVTTQHLFALFRPLGQLRKVSIQLDIATGLSRGFAFLSYRDPTEANLAIHAMSGQLLAGRPLKTGWGSNTVPSQLGVQVRTSDQMPADAPQRILESKRVLAQLVLGTPPLSLIAASAAQAAVMGAANSVGANGFIPTQGALPPAAASMPVAASNRAVPSVPTVADARASMLASSINQNVATIVQQAVMPRGPEDPTKIGNAESPSTAILVHNMFDKDEETEPGWPNDIREEFMEECSKFGQIQDIHVMANEPGGKIYAVFQTVEAARSCAVSLAGRWFDKRQLRVEFVPESRVPNKSL